MPDSNTFSQLFCNLRPGERVTFQWSEVGLYIERVHPGGLWLQRVISSVELESCKIDLIAETLGEMADELRRHESKG